MTILDRWANRAKRRGTGAAIARVAVAALLGYVGLRALIQAISPRPDNLGVRNGRLAPCPDMPNCVCSQCTDPRHAIAPLHYAGDPLEARNRLLAIVRQMPRSQVIVKQQDYVYAEFRTAIMGYTDDVEFYLPSDELIVHVRSAARLPYYDFDVNRSRIEEIRSRFR